MAIFDISGCIGCETCVKVCQICHLCRLSCPVDAITITPEKSIPVIVSWG